MAGGSDSKESACNTGDLGSIPGSGRSPEEGNGYPLQDSCLENPTDRGAWWATAHSVAKSQTRLIALSLSVWLWRKGKAGVGAPGPVTCLGVALGLSLLFCGMGGRIGRAHGATVRKGRSEAICGRGLCRLQGPLTPPSALTPSPR